MELLEITKEQEALIVGLLAIGAGTLIYQLLKKLLTYLDNSST